MPKKLDLHKTVYKEKVHVAFCWQNCIVRKNGTAVPV